MIMGGKIIVCIYFLIVLNELVGSKVYNMIKRLILF